jgi:formylglycine-generating enzyme required for sulfatase activity
MFSLVRIQAARQARRPWRFALYLLAVPLLLAASLASTEEPVRPTLPLPAAEAKTQAEMKAYAELIEHTDTTIEMLPIPGGEFLMGSPGGEKDRGDDEGPQHKVQIDPFWMAKCEITWDAYEIWMFDTDIQRRQIYGKKANERDRAAEAFQISQPTKPYTDMSFGMGKRGYPAICMTEFAAKTFCDWLSAKTGRYYRLPTEAEWEYACRAGTTTAYSFGDDPKQLGDYGWYFENALDKYQKIGQKKPNPWGLHDMHGNVAEWVLDQHTLDFYGRFGEATADNPLAIPTTLYPRVVRGGSWDSDPEECRSAARMKSEPGWKRQDPQIPKSVWYHTDATFVGFRIVRPLVEPTAEAKREKWEKSEPVIERISPRE